MWKLEPLQGCGPSGFGMTPDEVSLILGPPTISEGKFHAFKDIMPALAEKMRGRIEERRGEGLDFFRRPVITYVHGELSTIQSYNHQTDVVIGNFFPFRHSYTDMLKFIKKTCSALMGNRNIIVCFELGITIPSELKAAEYQDIVFFRRGEYEDKSHKLQPIPY